MREDPPSAPVIGTPGGSLGVSVDRIRMPILEYLLTIRSHVVLAFVRQFPCVGIWAVSTVVRRAGLVLGDRFVDLGHGLVKRRQEAHVLVPKASTVRIRPHLLVTVWSRSSKCWCLLPSRGRDCELPPAGATGGLRHSRRRCARCGGRCRRLRRSVVADRAAALVILGHGKPPSGTSGPVDHPSPMDSYTTASLLSQVIPLSGII